MTGEQSDRQRAMLAELAEANARLEAALAENAGLHAQLLTQAREAGALDERHRMAREIHDTLAQGFTGIVAQLEAARQNPGQWRRFADQAHDLARENLAEARRSVQALRPGHLEDAHLPEAITGLSERWSAASGIAVGLETTGDPRPMLADVEVALFRVAQEALNNVAKHARASRVGLTLSYMDDVVLLDVRDDGVGFDLGEVAGGFGLSSMRQRLLRVAGNLAIESSSRRGHRGERERPRPPGRRRSMIRLLIVDDHPIVRDGLRGVFAAEPDLTVVGEAADGAEAVECAAGADVVLMDLRMPGMGGVEAITRLRETYPHVRVLVLTTFDTDSDVLPAIEAGATGYLLKDAPREELLRAVRSAHRGESVLSPAVAGRLMGRVRKPAAGTGVLSKREREVLALVADGTTNREAARRLFVSEATIKTHLLHIYDKLGVRDRAAAVGEAYKRGLLS